MLNFGLQVSLLGIGVVFVGLVILWGIISSFSLFFNKKKIEQPVATPSVSAPVAAAPVAAAADDDELIAVIAAAIAACGGSGTVRAIKRTLGNGGTAWATRGRAEIMDSRNINA